MDEGINELNTELHFDFSERSPADFVNEITSKLSGSLNPIESVFITNPNGQNYVGTSIRGINKLMIQGAMGDYCLCSIQDCDCHVDGNAKDFLGHSIHSGIVVLNGHARNNVGALGTGGLIAVYGNAGDRVGFAADGADILIRGSVGSKAGCGMRSGTIAIGGSAGVDMGLGMRGGTIYLRGEAASISADLEEYRLREPDRLKIGLLLLKSGIKSAAGKDFRAFRPVELAATK